MTDTRATDEIILNENYWDCECRFFYFKPSTDSYCEICGAEKVDQPNSRQEEIDQFQKESQIDFHYEIAELNDDKTTESIDIADTLKEAIKIAKEYRRYHPEIAKIFVDRWIVDEYDNAEIDQNFNEIQF